MNTLTLRKSVFGILMALMLGFSMQGIADPLKLTAISDTIQEKRPNDAPFEVQFSVQLNSNTIAYNDENPRRRVTDGNQLGADATVVRTPTNASGIRIDSSGYQVTTVSGTERRLLPSGATLTPTGGTAVLNTPHPSYTTDTSNPPKAVAQAPDAVGPYFVDSSGNVYNSNGKAVYIRTGDGDRTATPQVPYKYTRAESNPNVVGSNPVPVERRFDYNEEQIRVIATDGIGIKIKGSNYFIAPAGTNLTEESGVLKTSMTLECDTKTPGTYQVIIEDATPAWDYPRGTSLLELRDRALTLATPIDPEAGWHRSQIMFTLRVTTEAEVENEEILAQRKGAGAPGVKYLRVDTGQAIEDVSADFQVTPENGNLQIRYKVIRGDGTLYAAATSTTGIYKGPNQDLTVHQSANVFLNTNRTTNTVSASIAGADRQTHEATIEYEYTGSDRRTTSETPTPPVPPTPPATTNTISASPSSISGAPGTTQSLTVSAGTATVRVQGTAFINAGGSISGTGATRSITLPNTPGSTYNLTLSASTYEDRIVPVAVTGSVQRGSLSVTKNGAQVGTQQQILVRANPAPSSNLTFTVTRGGITVGSGIIQSATGSGGALVTVPTIGSYTLIVRATGYTDSQVTFTAGQATPTTPTPTTPTPTPTVAPPEPSSIEISGPATRSGATVNQQLEASLLVRVLDDDGDGVADARVTFRVRTGQGRLQERGSGRATIAETDSRGFARANFTPTKAGTATVEASVIGVRDTVTFTISTGSAPPTTTTTTRTPDPDVTPSREINPVVQVNAANRPPMLWVDGGAIYALVGADVERFAPSVDNAISITIGGDKIYWTEQTGESAGTINSANLDGSGVKELKAIKAVPIGIAVDTAGSKLYWTNSRGRIQSLNADGSGRVENVRQNLPSLNDIAIARGNLYWTQYDATAGMGSVGIANSTGRGTPKTISTGADSPGSLVINGSKLYWTEMTGTSSGTINSANLNGTGAKQLASIRAVPMGIAVDAARSNLYWTNSRGKIQRADLNGKKIQSVVNELGSPGDMVLSNSITAPTAAPTPESSTTASQSKYDINRDGTVDSTDAGLIVLAISTGDTNNRLDVNGDGKVNFSDYVLVTENFTEEVSAGAPTLLGMKMTAVQIDRLQEQIDLLIASGDRSPATMRALIYFQQLIAMARPEKTQLLANYPNPFNPETWIPYELATDTDVRITIYNAQGVVIRTLQLGQQSAGYYTDRDRAAYWDGRNAFGEQVASGIYFYQLETDEISSLRKMVILK